MKNLILLFLIGIQQLASAQNGITWSAPVDVSASGFSNMHPRVAVDGAGNPMVLWGNANANKTYFSRWDGSAFTTPVVLNPPSIPVFAASWAGPDLASRGDTVYVTFKHTPEDANHIYVVHSYDGGANFSMPVQVDFIVDSISRFPAIAVDETGNPMVAFMKFNPGFSKARYVVARSVDFGNSFLPDVPASEYSGGDVCDCCPATIVSSGNTVATLYRDNLNNLRNSWAGISTDGGITFPDGIQVDDTDWMINSCPSSGPDGIIIGDTLYSVYMSGASGKSLCYMGKSSLSDGLSTPSIPLTGDFSGLALQNFPRMAGSGQAAAIVWKQTSNNASQLALLFTSDVVSGFPANYEVVTTSNAVNADVALDNGNIYIVWENLSSGTVKYRKGTYSTTGTGTPSLEQPVLNVYPNPLTDNILYAKVEGNPDSTIAYSVKDNTGREVLRQWAAAQNGLIKIDVSGLAGGFYFLEVRSGNRASVVKFVK